LLIDDYFRNTVAILQASPYVKSHNITFDRRSLTVGYIRGDVYFLNDSSLYFREFINTQAGIDRFTYVFHYQRSDGERVFRYDNSTHFPGLPGFPHHRHIGAGDEVAASHAPDLAQVVHEIEDQLATT
jgi:hypothetical protein